MIVSAHISWPRGVCSGLALLAGLSLALPAVASVGLENQDLVLTFADAKDGFACESIASAADPSVRFVHPAAGRPGLWSLLFHAPATAGRAAISNEVSNVSAARSVSADVSKDKVIFHWKGIDVADEKGVVDVDVTVSLVGPKSLWSIKVANRSKVVGLAWTDFPYLSTVVPVVGGSLLMPYGNWGGRITTGQRVAPLFETCDVCDYPSWTYTCQMSGFSPVHSPAYMDSIAPWLYVGTLDDAMMRKSIRFELDNSVRYRTPAMDASVPGAAGSTPFVTELTFFPAATWWDLAAHYRERAMKQPFMRKGPIVRRADYPKSLADVDYWVEANGDAGDVLSVYRATRKLFPKLNLGVHWYNWHHDFGPAPEVIGSTRVAECHLPSGGPDDWLPAREGVAAAVHEMKADGTVVMPYLNSRLYDRDLKTFPTAAPGACRRIDGTFSPEYYSEAGRRLVAMCPAATFWQTNHADLCRQTVAKYGFNSLYLDQIGSMQPVYCYATNHGHSLGGGDYWAAGYRKMLELCHADAVKGGYSLTTENFSEPYIDNCDGALAWSMRSPDDIPLAPALYSGYHIFFTAPQQEQDTLQAVRFQQARDFLWGCQIGWERPWFNGQWILKPESAAKLEFIRRLANARPSLRPFLSYGHLLGNADLGSLPTRTALLGAQEWDHPKPTVLTLPVVLGTVWADAADHVAVILVNPDTSDRVVTLRRPAAVSTAAKPALVSYGSDSGHAARLVPVAGGDCRVTLPAGAVASLVFNAPGASKSL